MLLVNQVFFMTFLSPSNIKQVFSKLSFILIISLFCTQYSFAELSKKQVLIESVNDVNISDMTSGARDNSQNLTLIASGNKFDLILEPNTGLLKKFTQSSASTQILYKGVIKGNDESWVRFSDIDGIYAGAIFDGKELFIVDSAGAIRESLSVSQLERFDALPSDTQIIYKASDITNTGVCGLEQHNHSSSNFNYQEFVEDLTLMAASSATRQLEVALVADTDFDQDHNGNAEQQMLSEMNMVDGIFSEQVNVNLSIVSTELLADGILETTDPEALVFAFRDYVFNEIGNPGVTHLFTGKNLNGNVLGIAFVAELCSSYGVGLTQNFGSSTFLVAAHELGHNFGAPHDNQSGSACSSTAGNRLMNPSINGSDQFSNCSLTQMNAHIDFVNSRTGGACVIDFQPIIAPEISSVADLNSTVGFAYNYDADNTVAVSGSAPILFTLDTFPTGMSITQEGLISWTPTAQQVGSNTVQITVSNSAGSDSQTFDVFVWEPISADLDVLDFNTSPPSSYGSEEDTVNNGIVTVENGGATLAMSGNRWQQVTFPYTISANTILEFEFRSTAEAEIQGIGFDNDLANSAANTFSVFGTEVWGIQDYRYNGDGAFEQFTIPVGQYYTGEMQYLFFVLDHDIAEPTGNAYFKNIKVYEGELSVEVTFPGALDDNVVPAAEIISVEAVISNDSNLALESVEFSLDQETWLTATDIDGTYQLDEFGPVDVGSGEIYVRLNGTTIQTVPYSAALRPSEEVGYYFVNPNWVGTEVNIFALVDNTNITINGVQQSLSKGDSITYTIATQGEYIFANKIFSVGTEANGLDLPVPMSFLGTEFVIPHVRYTHFYHLLSPVQDTQITIEIAGNTYQVALLAGVAQSFNAGNFNKTDAGIVSAELPIVVSHSTDNGTDAYPVSPTTNNLWGTRSTKAYVAAGTNNTSLTITSDLGDTQTFTLNAGDLREISIGDNSGQGRGSALTIAANKPVSAIQHADGDGAESTGFWNIDDFGTQFILPTDADYINVVCSEQTEVTITEPSEQNSSQMQCNGSNSVLGKVLFESSGSDFYAKGTAVEASAPIHLIYESTSTEDETNLMGFNVQGTSVTLGFIGSEAGTDLTTEQEFVATAVASNGGQANIQQLEFSIDGSEWFESTLVNDIYQYNFGTLDAGNYSLSVRVNLSSISTLTFRIANVLNDEEFGYYFINPKWVGETATIYAISDGTELFLAGNTVVLNRGDRLDHLITQQGEFISANRVFSVGASVDGLDLPVPSSFMGTEFIVPQIRYTHYYYLLSPNENAQVQITIGNNVIDVNLIAGEVQTINAGNINLESAIFLSSQPILVEHTTNNDYDTYPIQPVGAEVWGLRSKTAYVGASQDNTSITVFEESGLTESFTMSAGEVREIAIGSQASQGLGASLRISGDKPISAVQFGDGDGIKSTRFWSEYDFATDYIVPVASQYIVAVCNVTTSITLYTSSGNVLTSEECSPNSNGIGKSYFGDNSNGENIPQGARITASNPIYVIYEDSSTNDEHNIVGQ
jgi:ribosomal protein S11